MIQHTNTYVAMSTSCFAYQQCKASLNWTTVGHRLGSKIDFLAMSVDGMAEGSMPLSHQTATQSIKYTHCTSMISIMHTCWPLFVSHLQPVHLRQQCSVSCRHWGPAKSSHHPPVKFCAPAKSNCLRQITYSIHGGSPFSWTHL